MKKLFSILTMVATLGLFFACSDDSKTYEAPAKLSIVSSELVFTPAGGTNTIKTNAQGTLTVATTSTWLTVAVDGSTVTLTATPNDSLQTRAAIIDLIAGDAKATLTAQQQGLILDSIKVESCMFAATLNDPAQIENFGNIDFEAVPSADWIHWNKVESGYSITVDDNAGSYRSGTIALKYRDYSHSILVGQWGTTFPFEELNTATYKDENGNVLTKAITVVADPAVEDAYLLKGLIAEGDISLQLNSASDASNPEWFIPSGYSPGKLTEGSTTYTLRCMASLTNTNTGNRFIPTSTAPAQENGFRMAFNWSADATGKLTFGFVRNAQLQEMYDTDGFIVCKYSSATGAAAAARKGVVYYFLDFKLTKE